jgi:hypothetical protein
MLSLAARFYQLAIKYRMADSTPGGTDECLLGG